MTEDQEDFKPMLEGVKAEYRGVRWYVGNLRFWVMVCMVSSLVSIVTNAVTIWLYYYEARPTAKAAYDNIRSREKLLDVREQGLDQEKRQIEREKRQIEQEKQEVKRSRDTLEAFFMTK